MLLVGATAVDITPPLGSSVAGQFTDRRAKTIHDPLSTRSLVIDDGLTPVAFVTCDLLALKVRTVRAARERIEALTGIPAHNIMITATHTHTGPRTTDIFPVPSDAVYLASLPEKIATAVVQAYEARQPAKIGVGSGWEESASHNRRFLKKDGTAQMHPPKGDAAFVGPEGPDDPEVGVLVACGQDGHVLGAIVNYTSHPIVVGNEQAISADFPGYLVRALEAVKGARDAVLFINGAFANVCPIDVYDLKHREYGYRWAERVGHVVAGEALRVLEKTDLADDAPVRVGTRVIDLAIREVSDDDVARARALLTQPGTLPVRERAYAEEAVLVAEERRAHPTVRAEIQAIAVGDAVFVGVPGELFVEFGLDIKRRSPFLCTYIAGMANGCVGYIPTARAFAGGGYETRLARSSKLTAEAGEHIVETAVDLLRELHG